MQPDSTDWMIIDILRKGHVSNNEIARRLGVSEGMVRSRLKKMKEEGILEVRALIDINRIVGRQLALVSVSVSESRLLDAKAREIAALDAVQSVSIVSGRYDLIVEVLVDSSHGLVEFLTEALPQVAGIAKTESFVVLRSYGRHV
ncbi:MAG: Lrp/AsnC family transcriptional regulator [Lentisphaeria bacterium]|nr:Lrp/AsnC family transcriptional regulator [Lentisphaeria bacterium]